jgi:hypothetical protein
VRGWCSSHLHPKLAYLSGCYYCFSHWVALAVVLLAGRPLVLPGRRGYAVSWLVVVFVANVSLTGYNLARATLRGVRAWADYREELLSRRRQA